MTLYAVVNGESRSDLDNILFCSSNKDEAKEFLDYYCSDGSWSIEEIDAEINFSQRLPFSMLNELKAKCLMEVDGGTDDSWLRSSDVLNNIEKTFANYLKNKTA